MAKKRNLYAVDGIQVPGVTSLTGILMKEALIPWAVKKAIEAVAAQWLPGQTYTAEHIDLILRDAKNAHRVAKDTAGDIGSEVHALVEAYIGKQIKVSQVADPYKKRALQNFIKATKGWIWLGAEIVVLNEEFGYGGTADGIAELPDGRIVITDTKTSNSVHPEYDLQIAMYAAAKPMDPHMRLFWSKIEEGRILHFDKELCTWEVLERDVKSQFPYIEHFKQCYEWKKKFSPQNYSAKGSFPAH